MVDSRTHRASRAQVDSPLSLDFAPFETCVFAFSVIGATSIMSDGKSNWLKGLVLCAAYTVLAAVRWASAASRSLGRDCQAQVAFAAAHSAPFDRCILHLGCAAAECVKPPPGLVRQAFFFHVDPPGINGAKWVNKDRLPAGASFSAPTIGGAATVEG